MTSLRHYASYLVAALLAGLAATAQAQSREALGPNVLRLPVFEQRAEQGILTPVPIRLELPVELPAARVLVHYKIHGSKSWATLELKRRGKRWEGAIPCLEVSTITGVILYYVRVHDAEGAVVAYSASRHQPYRVRISYEPNSEQATARGRCPDPSDCPPGLPGCPSEIVERIPCKRDADCEGGLSCGWDGYCELDRRSYNWLSLGFDAGLGAVSTAGACSVTSQENQGYICRRSRDGATYTGEPLYTNEPIRVGTVPVRARLGFDRVLSYRTTLGLRVGYALFGAGPTPPGGNAFVPYSGELRVAHYLAEDPFAVTGWLPYLLASAGYSMYDVRVKVHVRESVIRPSAQGGNDLEQTLDVWRRAGDASLALGAGMLCRVTPGLGVFGEVVATQAFPFGATVLSGELGVRFGL